MTVPTTSALTGTQRSSRLIEIESAAGRAGRRFEPIAERVLDADLRDLASRLPGASGGIVVLPEMVGPNGIPDLVAVPLTTKLRERLGTNVPALTSWPAVRIVDACAPIQPRTLSMLAGVLHMDRETLRRHLRQLVDHQYLTIEAGGYVRSDWMIPVGRVYALEAKVSNWSGGLGQALRYAGWADAAGVVMHKLPRDFDRVAEQAESLKLGIALNNRWLVRPKIHVLPSAQRLWASEHVVAALASTPTDLNGLSR